MESSSTQPAASSSRRVSTLTFDPAKIPKTIQRDESDNNTFLDSECSKEGLLCQSCGETFSTQTSLSLHMRLHSLKAEALQQQQQQPQRPQFIRSFDGDDIDDDNDDDDAPTKTRKVYKRQKKYECSMCQKKFGSKEGIRSHMKVHSGETPFQCPCCDKRFALGRNLHRHITRAHKEHEQNAAEFCAKLMQEINSHENRKVVYTGEKPHPYKCGICSKTFRRLYRVKSHTRSHSGLKPFMCSYCSRLFSSSDNLYRHVKRLHNGETPVKKRGKQKGEQVVEPTTAAEPEKGTEFANQTTIIQIQDDSGSTFNIPIQQTAGNELTFLHTPRQGELFAVNGDGTDGSAPTYYIDLRTSEFAPAQHMEVQMVPEAPQQQHPEMDLQHHLPDHDDVEDDDDHDIELPQQDNDATQSTGQAFQCSLCRETFASGPLLSKHVSTHKFTTPSKCHLCGKEFKHESYLKRHMICHSDDKPFKCSLCPKAFNRQYRLNNHWRTHTGEKPYVCSVCDKPFAVSDNLYKHIKKIHKGLGLDCAASLVKQIQETNREKKYALMYGDYEVIDDQDVKM